MLSFGTYPEVPLRLARTRRAEARQLVAAGIDPSVARKQAKDVMQREALCTLEAVARAWLAHRAPGWTAGTLEAITGSLANHVFPMLGTRPVRDIAARDIKQFVQAIDKQGVCVWPWHLELSHVTPEHRGHGEHGGCVLRGGDGVGRALSERRRGDRLDAQASGGLLEALYQRALFDFNPGAAICGAAARRSGCSIASAAG